MIEKLDELELELAARTRKSITDLIAGVEDASVLTWDDRSPNWLTQNRIEKLAVEFKDGLVELGALAVDIHADCGGSDHAAMACTLSSSRDYWCVSAANDQTLRLEPVKSGPGCFRIDGVLFDSDIDACRFSISVRSGYPF